MKVLYSDPQNVELLSLHTPSETAKEYFFYATAMGHYKAVPSYYVERSGYKLLLVVYTVGGEGELEYKGEKYKLKKGDIFIIDCDEQQNYGTTGEVWDFYWIHIGGDVAKKYYKLITENKGFVFNASSDFVEQWHGIYRAMASGGFAEEPKISLLIHEFLTLILTGYALD